MSGEEEVFGKVSAVVETWQSMGRQGLSTMTLTAQVVQTLVTNRVVFAFLATRHR